MCWSFENTITLEILTNKTHVKWTKLKENLVISNKNGKKFLIPFGCIQTSFFC